MIAAFLLPFPFRGYRAPYLWVYYRLLHSLGERMLFITGRDYVASPQRWVAEGRWEMKEASQHRLGYVVPSAEAMDSQDYAFLPEAFFDELLSAHSGNPVAAFRQLLTERIPSLEAAFSALLSQRRPGEVEAVLSWCNCPSLSHVAAGLGIPVLHLEMGPLRWPLFRPTAYLDFSGVNGNTEAERRYRQSGLRFARADAPRLQRYFCQKPPPPEAPQFDAGVVLQVEDDSNLVAFGNGYDNMALLVRTHLRHPGGNVLVRPHPGSVFGLKPDWYRLDDSQDSLRFLRRCRCVATINSSVGLEALLFDVPVDVYGDCSYRFIADAADAVERSSRLAHYLFAYLVPQEAIYDASYLRFRLSRPSESDIVRHHLAAWNLDLDAWAADLGVEWS